jgi:hypothetical protein
MGQVSHFLGIEFTWQHLPGGLLAVSLTQQSFLESLLTSLSISIEGISTYTTPYKSGSSIDSIPCQEMSSSDPDTLHLKYQSIVGSLNWLAHTTRPDLSTVVSLLAQHQSLPSPGHLNAAHYVARYLATTRNLGIYFTSLRSPISESFLHFPLQSPLLSMSNANWGPQDTTQTKSKNEFFPLALAPCQLSTSIYLAHSIGCQCARLSLQGVLLKRRSMQRMNLSNSC